MEHPTDIATWGSDVSRETSARLAELEIIIRTESVNQNLIAASTVPLIRHRHILDSLQLLPLLAAGPFLDVGSGAGFPGLVLACAASDPAHLVEPRTKRAEFLRSAVKALGLGNVEVHACRVEALRLPVVGTITARAVATLTTLFTITQHLAGPDTRWLLPKGRSAAIELAEARRTWQGDFELVASRTDPEASIVVAERVRRI